MRLLLVLLLPTLAFSAEWSNESELSAIRSGGNTRAETYNLKTESTLKLEKSAYSLGGHYALGTTTANDDTTGDEETTETARNWDVHGKYERVISEKVNGFFAVKYEGDEFSGYKQKENYDLGAKYKIATAKEKNSFVELGYRYTTERTVNRDEDGDDVFNDNKARLYYERNQVIKEGVSYKFWTEYLKNFTRSEDYNINFEPSIAVTMSDMFSLKVAYKGMYDNDPAAEGLKYFDWVNTVSLIAKY